jgi:hypothetical protein
MNLGRHDLDLVIGRKKQQREPAHVDDNKQVTRSQRVRLRGNYEVTTNFSSLEASPPPPRASSSLHSMIIFINSS